MAARSSHAVVTVTVVLALVLPLGGGALAQPEDPLTPQERLFLQSHGPIRYVVGLEIPPSIFLDDRGRYAGVSIDLLDLWRVRLGVDHEVVPAANLTEALAMMRDGRADLIGPLTYRAERDAYLDFTANYTSGGIGFWALGDRSDLGDPGDLAAGSRISVVDGAFSSRWLAENRPELTAVPVEGTRTGLEAVVAGEVDAYLGGFNLIAFEVQGDATLEELRPLGSPVYRVDAAWAVPDDHKLLLSIVNKGMASVSQEELTAIYVRWTGYDLTPDSALGPSPPFYTQPLWQAVLGIGAGLILVLAAGAVVLRRQVHHRTQDLAASESRYRSLFHGVPVGVYRVDGEGRVREMNDELVRILGYPDRRSLERVIEADPTKFYADPEDRATIMDRLEAEGTLRAYEAELVRGDGQHVWAVLNVQLARGPDGSPGGFQGAILDVTARKRSEIELRRHADELARANEDLERFAYVASHDLKEPIRMVSSYVKLLEQRLGDELNPEEAEFMEYALEGSRRLHDLVGDLLDYSRVDRGGEAFAPVDLGEVLEGVVRNLDLRIRESGAQVTWGDLPTMEGDASQLGQLLENLVANALKFQEGGTPHVRVSARREEDRWVVSVEDDGIGVPPEHRERIFEVFQRLHGRDAYPGTGVGLAICRRIVERHGGRIWVEESDLGGSAFRFTIPDRGVGEPLGDRGSESAGA